MHWTDTFQNYYYCY